MNDLFYPETIKKLPIWILWKKERSDNGRITKIPYSANYDGHASSTNPKSWSTFEKANKKYIGSDKYDGIGIVLAKEYGIVFIDVDHSISEDGEMTSVGYDVMSTFKDQFVEVSQSGSGIHILLCGSIPRCFKNSEYGVEMYDKERFVAMTGKSIINSEPHEDPEGIDYIFNKYKTRSYEIPKKTITSDQQILSLSEEKIVEKAMKKGSKFRPLYEGNWSMAGYNSQNEGDLAMCLLLAFWTDKNPIIMDNIFRSSGLYRKKWEREDYRNSTINRAILKCEETLSEYIFRSRKEEGEEYEKYFLSGWNS